MDNKRRRRAREYLDKLAVGGFFLRFMDAVGDAQHLIHVRYNGRVAELGVVENGVTTVEIVMASQSLHWCRELVSVDRRKVSFNCHCAIRGHAGRGPNNARFRLQSSCIVEHITLTANDAFPRLPESN